MDIEIAKTVLKPDSDKRLGISLKPEMIEILLFSIKLET